MKKKVDFPEDLKDFTFPELTALAEDLRQTIIDVVSINGGHLASNLGIVELSVAMHFVFNSPVDKFLFDVSHQTYPHKLLTGRRNRFPTLRKYGGMCGFSHPEESPHDHFFAGHAGTALSLGLGLAKARDLARESNHVISVIGDASLTCGLTLEALNNVPKDLKKFLVVLNDNNMSISQNVGAITNILSRFLSNPTSNRLFHELEQFLSKIPNVGKVLAKQGHKCAESLKNLVSTAPFFEQFGLSYVGPIDGHDIEKLTNVLRALKNEPKPTLLHVLTTKGKGMETAINNPTSYHGCKPFDKLTGLFHAGSTGLTFPQIFGKHLLKMATEDSSIVTISPAMTAGSCLDELFKQFPERCIDVGIAEGHAVTYSGAIASRKNTKVVCSIYATFIQRALDNVFHDVCLQKSPVVFAVDRGGISGPDGSTHHGVYDISFLTAMPNMVVCQPRDGHVLKELLESCFSWGLPTAIRYPNMVTSEEGSFLRKRDLGTAEVLCEGKEILILALGHMNQTALQIGASMEKEGLFPTIVDPVFVKPLDTDLLEKLLPSHNLIVTIEEHSLQGGLGSALNKWLAENGATGVRVLNFGIGDVFLEHGSYKEVLEEAGLSEEKIRLAILAECNLVTEVL